MVRKTKEKGELKQVHASAPIHNANREVRIFLMKAIKEQIHMSRLRQAQVATLLGVTQPRISNLMRERVDLFAIDSLVNMLGRLGLKIQVNIVEPGRKRQSTSQ